MKGLLSKRKEIAKIILGESTGQEDVGKERKTETTYKQADNAGNVEEGAGGSMEDG